MKVKIRSMDAGSGLHDFVEIGAARVPKPKFRGMSWDRVTVTDKGEEVLAKLSVTKGGYFLRAGQWYRINLRDERTWAPFSDT